MDHPRSESFSNAQEFLVLRRGTRAESEGRLKFKQPRTRRSRDERNGSLGASSDGRPKAKPQKQIVASPGLRSMLYGLSMKLEREEKMQRKLQKKMKVQEEQAMKLVPTAPIDATKFVAYVNERRKKRILYKGEYLMVKRSVDPQRCTTELATKMGDRNSYPSTLPYDYNRVVLSTRDYDPDSHYINASYVQSWLREKAYVVTQSVKTKLASNEFWRMVWELNANCIVMLTKIFDFMRVMCHQYWPTSGRFQFGEIDVELLETKTYAHFVIRTFKLKRVDDPVEENARIMKHFHFTEWELDSQPYISAFIELRRRVRQWTDSQTTEAPLIVHCSDGGGRSGAFIALDANLELLRQTGQVDVYEYCKTMVNSRQNLVDSVEQYIFIYDVLCEAVLCNIQPIGMYELKTRSGMYRSRKDRELMELQDSHENKLLFMLTTPLRIGDCAGGHRLENRGKNRDVMVVPPDHARPYLQTLHGESKDYTYINAVEVDGFTRKREFIVTEWPKAQTIDSFWTLIFDHSCHTVVNLTNQSNSKQYPTFLHSKGKKNYGPFTIEVLNYQQYPGMTSHMVKISKRPSDPIKTDPDKQARGDVSKLTFLISEIMSNASAQQTVEAEVRICCIIQVRMWPIENKVPLSTTSLIELIKMTRSWRKRAPDRPETKPTIVMSHRCGVFVAANVCIDQMDMDHEVDVFHAVKMIRINRPQLVEMKDEYKFLHDVMLHWYLTNPEYAKFEPEESKKRDIELVEDEESDESEEPESANALTRLGRSFRRVSSRSRSRANSTTQAISVTPQPTSSRLQVNGNRSASRSPVYLND
ncbi:Tyrosine-protein phosphatase [Aphelenchoides besseyi]|nr:Tyrosine-protein phosphatase [Aphelenchoides besseyi]